MPYSWGSNRRWIGTFAVLAWSSAVSFAQVPQIVNPSFDEGRGTSPGGWTLTPGGMGDWKSSDPERGRFVTVTGNGDDFICWASDKRPLAPNTLYTVRVKAINTDARNGTAVLRAGIANRDLGLLSPTWREYANVFLSPTESMAENSNIGIGEWHMDGTVAFDDVELCVAQPIYKQEGGIALGDGERIDGNAYKFNAPYADRCTNHSRPIASQKCYFNTNRWNFDLASHVMYAHEIAGRKLTQFRVSPSVSQYASGELMVSASVREGEWQEIGSFGEDGMKSFDIPAEMLPADRVWIKLTSRAKKGILLAPAFVVSGYAVEATLDGPPVQLEGSTRYVSADMTDSRVDVNLVSLGACRPGPVNELVASATNRTDSPIQAVAKIEIKPEVSGQALTLIRDVTLAPGANEIRLPYTLKESGKYSISFGLGESVSYRMTTEFYVSPLFESSYGAHLPTSSVEVGLWAASSGWKVSQDRPVPNTATDALVVRAARNEVEAVQLVISPTVNVHNLRIMAASLNGPNGAFIPKENIELLRVRYLPVARPTDKVGVAAPWPDPLPPLTGPIEVPLGTNQPIWIRVTVPGGIPAGEYRGNLHITADGFDNTAPIRVEVFNFDLPKRMTCVATFGFNAGDVFRYQKVTDPAQQHSVLDLYLRDFSAHHIAPYIPAALDPFGVTWPGVDAYKNGQSKDVEASFRPTIDWTAWDAAMKKAIDEYGFNSFTIPIVGLGGGTFHSRTDPTLLDYAEGTPEYKAAFTSYCKQVEEHLKANGWLDEAYVYWFDEPDPKDYEFVMNGFRKIQEAAPGINRMLTEQVEEGLTGGPNIWCPISDAFNFEDAEKRRAFGEKFWWYVCTGPKEPYCTLFIDHPAMDLRVWLWQTWQRKIDGILVWQSNYWTSETAYPDPAQPQNPYEDPMGWTTGYGTPAGARIPWGNGDGRFIYPPEAAASGQQAETILEGPVSSIRWEMLRDGIEDYEYFVILKRLVGEAKAKGIDPAALVAFEQLLEVPAEITATTTQFTTDPAPLEARRALVAGAIEVLSGK
ncbi:MAG: glycoside hydrolase domain-containing protein [Candidatus Hydrogenedentales bacterium]